MVTGVHFLLTYSCTSECDHCFLHCGPSAKGTFTLRFLREALDQAADTGTVRSVYFEGGEPFLFYPLLVEGVRLARERGFAVGIVTNAYWATAEEDARLWLERLRSLGIEDLSVSDDDFHASADGPRPGRTALAAARALGMKTAPICIEHPKRSGTPPEKGAPVVGGGVRLRGRAIDKLAGEVPKHPASLFTECPHEDLRSPRRVHLDPYGLVQICQGLVIGDIGKKPLKEIIRDYDPEGHPIVGPLARGGPVALAERRGVPLDGSGYGDACHLCYNVRKALMGSHPAHLAPPQVYGADG